MAVNPNPIRLSPTHVREIQDIVILEIESALKRHNEKTILTDGQKEKIKELSVTVINNFFGRILFNRAWRQTLASMAVDVMVTNEVIGLYEPETIENFSAEKAERVLRDSLPLLAGEVFESL